MTNENKSSSRMRAIAIAALLVAAFLGIYLFSTSSSTSKTTDTLYIDEPYWPGSVNQLTNPYPNWQMYTVYQPLVTVNGSLQQQTGEIQYLPVLAEKWSVSPDQRTFTFDLKDVEFSSGNPFNAYQLWGQLYGLYYLSAGSPSWWNGYQIFNMSAVDFGPSTLALMNETGLVSPSETLLAVMQNNSWPIYVTGPHQIVFHLKSPFPWFLGTFVAYAGLIFDTQWVLDHGGFGAPAHVNTYFNLNPIPGTGPYVVREVSSNQFVRFTKNPNYWGNTLTAAQVRSNPYVDPGHVETVVITVRTTDVARYADLSSGQASIAAIESANWPLVVSKPDKFAHALLPPNPGLVIGIAMNTHRYPTNITAVRLAIEHAVDLNDINDKAYFGTLSPWVGPQYPAVKDFYNLGGFQGYEHNVTLSKQILANANIDVPNLPALEFTVLSGCAHCSNTAQIIQSDLAKIGIAVRISVLPTTEFFSTPPNAGFVSYSAALASADQDSHLTWFGSATFGMTAITPADLLLQAVNGNSLCCNYAMYSNPIVQSCVDGFFSGASAAQLQSLCLKAQQQVNADAPYIWVGTPTLPLGAGSIVYDKAVVSGFLIDPVYTGQSDTAIFNTVTFH